MRRRGGSHTHKHTHTCTPCLDWSCLSLSHSCANFIYGIMAHLLSSVFRFFDLHRKPFMQNFKFKDTHREAEISKISWYRAAYFILFIIVILIFPYIFLIFINHHPLLSSIIFIICLLCYSKRLKNQVCLRPTIFTTFLDDTNYFPSF